MASYATQTVVLFILALGMSCLNAGESSAQRAEGLGPPRRLNLSPYCDCRNDVVNLDFAGRRAWVCAWWWPHRRAGDYTREPVEYIVLDLDGNIIGGSQQTNRADRLEEFPTIAWRKVRGQFVKDATGWAFSRNLSKGLRILADDERFFAEFWDLRQAGRRAWRIPLPAGAVAPHPVAMFLDSETSPVLLALNGATAIVIDTQTGKISNTINFGAAKLDKSPGKRSPEIRRPGPADAPSRFRSFEADYDARAGLAAFGEFSGQRVRVIRLSQPDIVLFEANTDADSTKPAGGTWYLQRVAFLSGGMYLLAEYHFGGPGARTVLEPSDIFETRTWKRVWRDASNDVHAVSLSRDGKTMAVLRGNTLEFQTFAPIAENTRE
jgi:hypothetical protein